MADNQSRALALRALATISQALSLLEAGMLGVLRYGATAEVGHLLLPLILLLLLLLPLPLQVVHGLDQQWSRAAGRRVGGQFTFDQKSTSVVRCGQGFVYFVFIYLFMYFYFVFKLFCDATLQPVGPVWAAVRAAPGGGGQGRQRLPAPRHRLRRPGHLPRGQGQGGPGGLLLVIVFSLVYFPA